MDIRASIIATGNELLLGEIIDTNSSYISQSLFEMGIGLRRIVIVGDDKESIKRELDRSLKDSDLIITTGGLGPTKDDLTRFAVSDILGKKLVLKDDLLEDIRKIFERYKFKMTEENVVQALIPEGAIPIRNPIGTAPGFIIGKIICLPGVPEELKIMWEKSCIPYIRKKFQLPDVYKKTFRICGLSESKVNKRLGDIWEEKDTNIGINVGKGEIRIRVITSSREVMERVEEKIRKIFGESLVGEGEMGLKEVLKKLFEELDVNISVEEDLATSGLISSHLGDTARDRFIGGIVKGTKGDGRVVKVVSSEEENGIRLRIEMGSRVSERLFPAKNDKERYVTYVLDSLRRDLLKLQKGDGGFEPPTLGSGGRCSIP